MPRPPSGNQDPGAPRWPGSGPVSPRSRAAVQRALDEAAQAVLENRDAWRWQALDPDEASETMDRLIRFITGEQESEDRKSYGSAAALGLSLSEILRQELLRDSRGLGDRPLLDLLRRIERCRLSLVPTSQQELTFLLTGATALELVVEFAHDLRSPLTSIMFLSETLRKGQSGEINDVQRSQLGIIYSAALSMVGLANDLMDLARSEVDEKWGYTATESFSLQEVIESVRNTVAPMAEQKRLGIGFLSSPHDARLGRPILLNRVLLNLLTNAIKFTDTGRVEIVIEDIGPDRTRFSVTDTGRGMKPEAIERLYTLLERSESSTGYHFSGTGLGLSISERMVELMGGELQVESRSGEGARFWFEIPLPRQ